MTKVRMLIEFEADVGGCQEERECFLDEAMKELVLHSNSIGDTISDDVKVLGVSLLDVVEDE